MSIKKPVFSSEKLQPRIRIKLKSFDQRLLDVSLKQIIEVGKRSGVHICGPIPLPSKRKVWSVPRSPSRFKDSMDQYQQIEYKRILDIINPNEKTIATLKKDISIPPGVEIFVSHIG